jgi:hypothetical protein
VSHRRTALVTSLLILAVLLTGCSSSRSTEPGAGASTEGGSHDPSPAEVDALRQELAGIDGVTRVVTFSYRRGTFENGASTNASFESAAGSAKELEAVLDATYRLSWLRPGVDLGTLIYVVRNPATGTEVGAVDLGFSTASVGPDQLQQRYGPASTR